MEVKVETHSGYKADEYPTKVWFNDMVLEIIDIEDRWYGPSESYFKIFLENGERYILKQNRKSYAWEIKKISG